MADANKDFSIDAKSSWLIVQGNSRGDLLGSTLKASFDFGRDGNLVVRMRAMDNAAPEGVASVSFEFETLLKAFEIFCEKSEFERTTMNEAFVYSSSKAKDPYDTNRVNDVSRAKTTMSIDKFTSELYTIAKLADIFGQLKDRANDLTTRYKESSFGKRVLHHR